MSQTHLTERERYAIQTYRHQGWSIRRVADQIGRTPSTVSRELRRNGPDGSVYDSQRAQWMAKERQRTRSSRPWKVTDRMRRAIIGRLRRGDSPDIIAGERRSEGNEMISGEWIYQLIYRDRGAGGELWRCLASKRRGRKQRIRVADRRGQLLNRVMIGERPAEVDRRERVGDWEGDSLVGRGNRSRLITLVERQSRYVRLVRPCDLTADAAAEAIVRALRTEVVQSITVDNGKEFARHEWIGKRLNVQVYFAEPYSPWQRGSNEHLNGMLRRYFPKGTDFSRVTDTDIEAVENKLNNRPRTLLRYATSWRVYSGRDSPPVVAF